MRYIKVLLLVLVFFFVMMFFVQNQTSFSNPVTLRLDLLFFPLMESIPLPMYSIMLISFAAGALLVLFMLMWDRMTISGRIVSAKHKISSLEKKLEKVQTQLQASEEEHTAATAKLQEKAEASELEHKNTEAMLKEQLAKAESRLNAAVSQSAE